jgi:hypothetical protein
MCSLVGYYNKLSVLEDICEKDMTEKITVLVAGVAHMGEKHTGVVARDIFQTNVFGVQKVDEIFLPLVKSRSIIVTAGLGSNAAQSSSAANTLTIEKLNANAEQYFNNLDNGREKN